MKKLFAGIVAIALMSSSYLKAQDVDAIKNMLVIQQYDKAKAELDKAMTKSKFAEKPEPYILQSTILAGMMQQDAHKNDMETLRTDAIKSYDTYLAKDPEKKLVKDNFYINTPVAFYSSYFNEGINNYNAKKWEEAAASFDNTVKWSDFIKKEGVANISFDTTAYLLAGASHQNAKNIDKAKTYFTAIADQKIGGEDNEFLYQFLVRQHFTENNIAEFEKYKKLGQELYPNSEYFKYSEEDFILGMEDEEAKAKRIEEKIAKDPSNTKLLETYGLTLFDELNKEGAERPANYDQKEKAMLDALNKVYAADDTNGRVMYYAGNHYLNKSVRINGEANEVTEEIRKIQADAKPDPKTGKKPAPPAELVAKRTELQKASAAEVDNGLPYLIKAMDGYKKHGNLSGIEKQEYKRCADQMIVIYEDRYRTEKDAAKKKQYEAEIAKYTAIYDSIK